MRDVDGSFHFLSADGVASLAPAPGRENKHEIPSAHHHDPSAGLERTTETILAAIILENQEFSKLSEISALPGNRVSESILDLEIKATDHGAEIHCKPDTEVITTNRSIEATVRLAVHCEY